LTDSKRTHSVHGIYTIMRQPTRQTAETLLRCKTGSFAKLRQELGVTVSAGVLSRIARGVGPVSLAAENEVRRALGLQPIIPPMAPAPVCPHCGIVHAVGDCGGVGGDAVILPPDARIVMRNGKRKARKRDDWRPRIPRRLRGELEPIIRKVIEEARNEKTT